MESNIGRVVAMGKYAPCKIAGGEIDDAGGQFCGVMAKVGWGGNAVAANEHVESWECGGRHVFW